MGRFVQFINTADADLAKELISKDAIFYVPGNPEAMRGPEGYINIIHMMRSGFPDIQWTIDDLIIEDEKVVARFTMKGTHQNTFFNIPATQNTIKVKAMNFYQFQNGKIIEEYGMPDMLGLLHQIEAN